jgi:hypothetical protein
MLVLGIVVVTIIADLIIDALTPDRTTAFYYRLVANVCIVIIFAIIWFKVEGVKKRGKKS